MNKKVILMILDGWGTSPDPKVSAIDHANTPFIDGLYDNYAHASLRTDGLHVGLPEGQMGNSEVGHMNLGAGRIVYQDLAKINLAVANKTLGSEVVLKEAIAYAKANDKQETPDVCSRRLQTFKGVAALTICRILTSVLKTYPEPDLRQLTSLLTLRQLEILAMNLALHRMHPKQVQMKQTQGKSWTLRWIRHPVLQESRLNLIQ